MDIIEKIELQSYYDQQDNYDPNKETVQEFWAWWKKLCAEMDSKPKHIVRSDRWQEKKKGGRKK